MKTAFFSILAPGKHLPPHRGPYKGVMRYHLGLLIPSRPISADPRRHRDPPLGRGLLDDLRRHLRARGLERDRPHARRAVRRLRPPAARPARWLNARGAVGDRLLALHRRRQAPPQRLGEALRSDEGQARDSGVSCFPGLRADRATLAMVRATPLLLIAAALAFAPTAQAAPRAPPSGRRRLRLRGAPVDSVSATSACRRSVRARPEARSRPPGSVLRRPARTARSSRSASTSSTGFWATERASTTRSGATRRFTTTALRFSMCTPGDVVAVSLRRPVHGWRLAVVDATTRAAHASTPATRRAAISTSPSSAGGPDLRAAATARSPTPGYEGCLPQPSRQSRADGPRPASGLSLAVDDDKPRRPRSDQTRGRRLQPAPRAPRLGRSDLHSHRRATGRRRGRVRRRRGALEHGDAASADRRRKRAVRGGAAGELARAFARAHWPPRLLPFVHALVVKTRADAAIVAAAPQQATADLSAGRAASARAGRALSAAAYRVHIRTHAPSIFY